MEFRNYCIVVLGKTDGCIEEISKVADNTPTFLPAKGITIVTFKSVAEMAELNEYFKGFSRNFFLIDLAKDMSGYNFQNKKIHNKLFGDIENQSEVELENLTNKLIDDIKNDSSVKTSGTTNSNVTDVSKANGETINLSDNFSDRLTVNIAKSLKSEKERITMMNKILDKGSENLTEVDREVLGILSNNS